jgi:hypothetical protein
MRTDGSNRRRAARARPEGAPPAHLALTDSGRTRFSKRFATEGAPARTTLLRLAAQSSTPPRSLRCRPGSQPQSARARIPDFRAPSASGGGRGRRRRGLRAPAARPGSSPAPPSGRGRPPPDPLPSARERSRSAARPAARASRPRRSRARSDPEPAVAAAAAWPGVGLPGADAPAPCRSPPSCSPGPGPPPASPALARRASRGACGARPGAGARPPPRARAGRRHHGSAAAVPARAPVIRRLTCRQEAGKSGFRCQPRDDEQSVARASARSLRPYRATVEHCSIALVHGHAGVYLLPSGTNAAVAGRRR